MTALKESTAIWTPICTFDSLLPERGAAALVGEFQVALFRMFDGTLHAVGNCDPFTGANVLSRGIVGSRGGITTVASPLYKQVFDLASGACLDDGSVSIPVYAVRCVDGVVEISSDVT